uniref:BPL/LPL catalytic domain-containing protein n=1 Tax=Timema bartmani TaxID=61472 RepID=A0A7R9F7V4_9NEOP|nr:unnamed protein product [Timema bartmani]
MAQTLLSITMKTVSKVLAFNSFAKKNSLLATSFCSHSMCSTNSRYLTEQTQSKIKKSVFISQSTDIFTNLALEDWMYRNFDFTDQHVLLLWHNSPCVVIGRHQNPWLEANIEHLYKSDVEIARRNSGGGAVYHDMGNLNITFFTPRTRYNRRHNLEIITRALFREWGLVTDINSREDIIIKGNYKQISGTASKLGSPNAYHHCTVLVDVNKVNLRQALQKQTMGISTNATQSTPSPVMNLCEVNSHINMEQLFSAVGWEFLRTCPQSMQDGGHDLISQQYGFQLVNPTEGWFPGLEKSREELASWDWRFGKTPKFQVTRSFRVPEELTEDSMADEELRIKLDINNGIIEDITLQIPPGFMSASGFHGDASVITNLRGQRFSEEAVIFLEKSLNDVKKTGNHLEMEAYKNEFVVNCVKQVMKRQASEREESLSSQQCEGISAIYRREREGISPIYRREREGSWVSCRRECEGSSVSCRGVGSLLSIVGLGSGPNSHEKNCRGSAILGPEEMVAGVHALGQAARV